MCIDDTDDNDWQININFTLSSGLVNGGLHELSDEDCLYLNVYVPDTEADMRNMFDVLLLLETFKTLT